MLVPRLKSTRFSPGLLGLLILGGSLSASAGEAPVLQWSGDFRARLESDWNSHKSDGSQREDRDRLRARARLGVGIRPDETMTFGFRLRTGSESSHQSPHITLIDFDDNDTGDASVNFDKWYMRYSAGPGWAWVGREASPFWQQNELFWDEDVTLIGIASGYKLGGISATAGAFSLPVGMRAFAGNLAAAQLVYSGKWGEQAYTLAASQHAFNSNADDPDAARLRNGNGKRDYRIGSLNAQWKMPLAGRPLTFGVDRYHNRESYSAATPHRNATDGSVYSLSYGQLKEPGSWQLGYYHADIEQFAVNASYAQDDWMRWGSADETDASDFSGDEARLAYALSKSANLILRFYDVEANSSVQDGKRLRLDYNYRY